MNLFPHQKRLNKIGGDKSKKSLEWICEHMLEKYRWLNRFNFLEGNHALYWKTWFC